MSQASAVPDEPTTLPVTKAEQPPGPAWVDLASHRPGHAVLAHIASLLTPPGADVEPAGSSPRPEGVEPWAVGFVGEEKVGLELALLDERWRVLHGVPIGHDGSDIDHGSSAHQGVFTINTKDHRGKRLDVRGDAVFIGRNYQRYVPNARHGADRTRAALTADLPTPCPVTPVICTVGATLSIARPPATCGSWKTTASSRHPPHSTPCSPLRRSTGSTTERDGQPRGPPRPTRPRARRGGRARQTARGPAHAGAPRDRVRSHRPGARVGRPALTRPRHTSPRRRKAAPARSPARLLFTIIVLAAFLLAGPQTITAVTRAITGPLVAALPPTPAVPRTD